MALRWRGACIHAAPSFAWMLAHTCGRRCVRSKLLSVCLVCPSRTHANQHHEINYSFSPYCYHCCCYYAPTLTPRTYCTHTAVGPQVLGRNCRFLQGPDTDPKAVEKIRKASASARVRSLCLAAGRCIFAAARHRGRKAGYEPPPPRKWRLRPLNNTCDFLTKIIFNNTWSSSGVAPPPKPVIGCFAAIPLLCAHP